MVFNATFNNISVISWWSVLLAEETGVPRENYQPSKLYILYLLDKVFISEWSLSNHESKGSISIQVLHKKSTQRVINKQVHFICIGSCNSTYHTITATAASLVIAW